jgi:hypothetical protein
MSSELLKIVVRSIFLFTSRDRAIDQANRLLDRYLGLAEGLSVEQRQCAVLVPPMRGVDEDMRQWSFFMILQHNAIVNRCISAIVEQLARNAPELSGAAVMDPRKDVMPSSSAGVEQVMAFRKSVHEHVEMLKGLGKLRGTRTAPHPVFGAFDAHMWNCMFSFHLRVHYNQAEYVVRDVKHE